MVSEISITDPAILWKSDCVVNHKAINVQFIKYGVINLVEGHDLSKLTVRQKIFNLRVFLDKLMEGIDIRSVILVVESQPGMNVLSNSVEDAIYMYFAYCFDIVTIGSSKKNTFSFTDALSVNSFYSKYTTVRTANKAHTTANLEYYCGAYNIPLNIHKSLYNHLADAFMQLVYYVADKVRSLHSGDVINVLMNDTNINNTVPSMLATELKDKKKVVKKTTKRTVKVSGPALSAKTRINASGAHSIDEITSIV
jgi:TusA-related sulfurtransferase